MNEPVYYKSIRLVTEPRVLPKQPAIDSGCKGCFGKFVGSPICAQMPSCGNAEKGTGIRFVPDMTDDETVDKIALMRLRGEL